MIHHDPSVTPVFYHYLYHHVSGHQLIIRQQMISTVWRQRRHYKKSVYQKKTGDVVPGWLIPKSSLTVWEVYIFWEFWFKTIKCGNIYQKNMKYQDCWLGVSSDFRDKSKIHSGHNYLKTTFRYSVGLKAAQVAPCGRGEVAGVFYQIGSASFS